MNIIKTMLLAAVPLMEQKGAIPLGIYKYGLSPMTAFIVTLIGSFLPVPFVLILFNSIFAFMKKHEVFGPINKFIERKIEKGSKNMEKYKELGLIIFIGIPLPTTGLWTGSAIASFLKLDFKKSIVCALIGGTISGTIITFISVYFPHMLGY